MQATSQAQKMIAESAPRSEADVRQLLDVLSTKRPPMWSPDETTTYVEALRWVLGGSLEIREAWLAMELALRGV